MFPSTNVRAILWATLGCLLIASMWALAKALGSRFDSQQIAFFRALSGLLLVLPLFFVHGFRIIRTNRLGLHVARGVAGAIGMMCGFYAVTRLPLGDATALSFTQPLFLVLLAALFLREDVGLRRWGLVACGFLGVIIMVRPGFDHVDLVTMIALAGALAAACVKMFVKQLAVTEAPLTILFYLAVVMTLVTAGPAWLHWQNPTLPEHAALLSTGVLATLAQLCIIRAYKSGEASAVAPAEYSRLLFATFYGVVLFGEVLDPMFLLGAAIIILSTLYVDHDQAAPSPVDPDILVPVRQRHPFGRQFAACSVAILCCLVGFSAALNERSELSSPLPNGASPPSAIAQGAPLTLAVADLLPSTQTISEHENVAVLEVRLQEPAARLTFLAYTTVERSARQGQDYQRSRGVIALKPGDVSATLQLPIIDDDLAEGMEWFEVWLSAAPNVARLLRSKAVITIRPNDRGSGAFQSGMLSDR